MHRFRSKAFGSRLGVATSSAAGSGRLTDLCGSFRDSEIEVEGIEEAFVATKSDSKDPKMPLKPVPSIRTIEGWKTLGLR